MKGRPEPLEIDAVVAGGREPQIEQSRCTAAHAVDDIVLRPIQVRAAVPLLPLSARRFEILLEVLGDTGENHTQRSELIASRYKRQKFTGALASVAGKASQRPQQPTALRALDTTIRDHGERRLGIIGDGAGAERPIDGERPCESAAANAI